MDHARRAAAVSLVFAGVALADFTQTSNVALTATHAGKSTGIKSDIYSTTSPGEAPKAAKLLMLAFPAGTKFDLGSVKPCKLSAHPRRREGPRGRAQQDGHRGEGDFPDPTDARDPGDHLRPEAHDPRPLADGWRGSRSCSCP